MNPDTSSSILNTSTASIPMDIALFSVTRAEKPNAPNGDESNIVGQILWKQFYEQLMAFEDCSFVVTAHVGRAVIRQVGKDAELLLRARGWITQCEECRRWAVPSSESKGLCEMCMENAREFAELQSERRAEAAMDAYASGYSFVVG